MQRIRSQLAGSATNALSRSRARQAVAQARARQGVAQDGGAEPASGRRSAMRALLSSVPSSASPAASRQAGVRLSDVAPNGQGDGPGAGSNGPANVQDAHPLDAMLQRAFSHISAEAFITDFVRQAIEANRSRGNPPASQFAIEHLSEHTLLEESKEPCTVCQDAVESGAITLTMPCNHSFHKDCLLPWLKEHNTCPICRCEIESSCARYNQQNFGKLRGELSTETVCSCSMPLQDPCCLLVVFSCPALSWLCSQS